MLPHSARVFAALADAGVPMTHFGVGTAELLGAMSEAVSPAPARCVGVDWRTSLTDAAARVRARARRCRATSIPWCCWRAGRWSSSAARAVVEDGRRAVDAGAAGHVFNLGHGVLPATDPGSC